MSTEIVHFHSTQCDSTQTQILNHLQHNPDSANLLFSTSFQTLGRGRQGNSWLSTSNSLAMSFLIEPNEVLTLSSLELGVLICEFFNSFDLCLKWPNDILTHDLYKCGGILCQTHSGNIVAGIGINFGQSPRLDKCDEYKFGRSSITNQSLDDAGVSKLCLELYQFILNNRLTAQDVTRKWNNRCAHLNKRVLIKDDTFALDGIFKGIGSNGEALVENKGLIQKAYSGSIFLV